MKEVLGIINSVLDSMGIDKIYLGYNFRGTRYYHEMLRKNIKESDFGIVVLNGLRPNVTYEFGLLQMSNIEVIPLIKNDAKISVRSLYYNIHEKCIDPELAFGNYYYRKSAFDNLIEPKIIIQEHFSDCQGMHQVIYTTIDDTEEIGSLGRVLREEITKIIPYLRSRSGPGFNKVRFMFPDINASILDESIRLLSLFSVLGWNKYYDGDITFQSIRKEFLSLFINQPVSEDQINTIFNSLLDSSENILKNYGRYLTIDSEKLIRESFKYFLENTEVFRRYYIQIMKSSEPEISRRFLERIKSSEYIGEDNKEAIGKYIFERLNIFTDISILQDKDLCKIFINSASINPTKALDLLYDWITPLTPMKMAELFSFESTLISPGNPHDNVLWFLNYISKNDEFFAQSMEILFEFSLPIIVNEERIQTQIYSYIDRLALDRFLEQCHSLEGKVNVATRWHFIKSISWLENWPDDYIRATKDLKFRAIKTFLQKTWTIPGPVKEGSLKINRYTIHNGLNYEALEICRTEAYNLLMEWLDQKNEYKHIYNELFEYSYQNLSNWVKYIPWDEIKHLYEKIFIEDTQKTLIFLSYIDNLRVYDTWQQEYSHENLKEVLQFHSELEKSLTTINYFRRKLGFSMFSDDNKIQEFISLMEKYKSQGNSERGELNRFLISENLFQSFEFGTFFANQLSIEELKDFMILSTELVSTLNKDSLSEFYLGLWSILFRTNEQQWENLLNDNWDNSNIQPYIKRILWAVGDRISNFIWRKYLYLFNTGMIEPVDMINVFLKKLPSTITNEEIKSILVKCIESIGETIHSKNPYPIKEYIFVLWNLERIFQVNEDLPDDILATSILENLSPINKEILSQLHNKEIIIKLGKLAKGSFEKWLKSGFSTSGIKGDDFIIRCADDFIEQIFQITKDLFSLPQNVNEYTEEHKILNSFEITGDPNILLRFSSDNIDTLYELNSSKLGYLFGRLIRNSPIENPFPPDLERLIIHHIEDIDFKNKIFQAFSEDVRSFVGNNYDQQFSEDYIRIGHWREYATDNIFREWLKELHQYIDSLRDQSREFWREMEVE